MLGMYGSAKETEILDFIRVDGDHNAENLESDEAIKLLS